jgi:predicted transcriptional regulator of viral defense system
MNRVVTILSELVEVIKPANLNKTAKSYSQTAAVQRLGYLFETELNAPKLSAILYEIIGTKLGVNISLMPGKDKIGEVDLKWKIIHNVTIESDL